MHTERESLQEVNDHIDQQVKLRAIYNQSGFTSNIKSQKWEEIVKKKDKFEDNFFIPNNGSIYNYSEHADLMRKKAQAYKHHVEVR